MVFPRQDHVDLPKHSFRTGMKLEIVSRWEQLQICPVSVTKVTQAFSCTVSMKPLPPLPPPQPSAAAVRALPRIFNMFLWGMWLLPPSSVWIPTTGMWCFLVQTRAFNLWHVKGLAQNTCTINTNRQKDTEFYLTSGSWICPEIRIYSPLCWNLSFLPHRFLFSASLLLFSLSNLCFFFTMKACLESNSIKLYL